MENVKNYMKIQQIRNSNLFRYKIECEVDAQKEQIVKLILQPIVENAIFHGVETKPGGGKMFWIFLSRRDV